MKLWVCRSNTEIKSFSGMLRRILCFICSKSNIDNGLKDIVCIVVGVLEVPLEWRGLVQRCRRRRSMTSRRRSMTRVRRRNMVGLVGRLAGVGFGSSREWSPRSVPRSVEGRRRIGKPARPPRSSLQSSLVLPPDHYCYKPQPCHIFSSQIQTIPLCKNCL